MSMGALRAAFVVATVVAFGVVSLAFAAAPEVGAAYRRLIGPLGTALPVPTQHVALPLLRTGSGGALDGPTTSPAAAVVWGGLLLGPWAGLAWALRAPDVAAGVARWVVAWSIYLALGAVVLGAVVLGLALPFGRLGG